MPTSPFDIKISTIGGTALGYMLRKGSGGRRGWKVEDAQTIAPRFLTQDQITQAQLPPDLALTFPQDTWRRGIGGLLYRNHPESLADNAYIDITEQGVLKLARLTTATTVDSNPDEYVPSGFAVSGTQVWAFIGRDVYSWDFTNKEWDIQTEPVAAARLYRSGVPFEGQIYIPSWADDAGSGGSYTADDEPCSYLHKTPSAAQWTVITTGATLGGCKYMAVADSKLWGGYWSSHADANVDIETDYISDVGASGSAVSSVTTGAITPGPASGSRLMLVTVHLETSGGPAAVSTVAFGAQSCTLLRRQVNSTVSVEVWYLKNPTASAATVVATLGATEDTAQCHVHVYADVDPDTTFGTSVSATGSSTSPLVAVTGVADDLVFNAVSIQNVGNATVAGPATRRTHRAGGSLRGATSDHESTTTPTSSVWTSGNAPWAIVGVAIKAGVRSDATVFRTDASPSSNLSAGDVIRYGAGAEAMLVTTVTDGDPSLTVVRGYRGSVAANHAGNTLNEVTENPHQVRSTPDGTSMANWSTATSIGDSFSPITAIVGVGSDLIIIKTDGIYRLEADGTVTNLRPELTAFGHEDFGKGAWAWNDKVFIPLHGGGIWEMETNTWSIQDISFEKAMPEQTQYHGRVVAGHGEPGRLYVLVAETGNTQYHVLTTENPDQTGLGDYNWSHVSTIGYTTGTDLNHAALLLEAVTNGSDEHHRLLVGVESTASNLLPRFIPHDGHDDDAEYSNATAEAYTVAFDAGFPNVLKRAQDIVCNTNDLGATGGANHYIEVRYRIDGGAWTYVTGTQSTSTLTSDNQTLSFAAGITFYKIEFRFTPVRKTSGDNTTPELHDFTFTCQLRTASIKLVPLSLYCANGMMLRDGRIENQARTKRNQLRTWNGQAAEVVLTDVEGGTRNCLFLPGVMREEEVLNPYHSFPEYVISVVLGEVG